MHWLPTILTPRSLVKKIKKKHKPFEVNSFLVTLMNVVLGFFRKSWSLISFVLVM